MKEHTIPLYSLVEINSDEDNGIRLYVQKHSRDCDGTPLYDLTYDIKMVGKTVALDSFFKEVNKSPLDAVWKAVDFGKVISHFSEQSLTVIKEGNEVISNLKKNGYSFDSNGIIIED